MNIRDFEYLIAIDELKSFIKAANKCFISQPALSQQVKKIEDQLGVKIFERDKKSIITTSKGKQIINLAKEIIYSYNKIKEVNSEQIKINIGLIPTICPYLLPHIVDELNSKLPNVKFYFSELKTETLLKKLRLGEIDLGIIAYFDNLIDEKLHYQKLYDEEFLLALNKNSNLNAKDFGKILDDKKLILLEEGNCMSDNIKDICSLKQNSSFNDFFATNIETVKNMIRINNGIGLLPKLSCLNETNLKIESLKSKKFREVGIVSRKNYDEGNLINKIDQSIKNSVEKILAN